MGRTNPSAANNTAAFSQLQAENDALKKENRDLRQKLERMNELLLNAQRARFGSSSEKQDYVMPNQVGIFNEAEAEQDPKAPEPTEETILVPAHTRKPKRTMDELAACVVCSKRLLNQAVGKSLRTHNLKPKKGAQVMRKNEKITALYERLSRDDFGKDDDQQRESNSISNQKAMLEEFAARQGFTNIVHFTDDGISGTCFVEVR